MSAETDIETRVDLERNAATVTIIEERELTIDQLFDDNSELRLWEDDAGWSGYLREEHNGVAIYHINTRHDEDDWIRKVRVGEQAVLDAVTDHIEDRHAGGRGRFVRRCSPP